MYGEKMAFPSYYEASDFVKAQSVNPAIMQFSWIRVRQKLFGASHLFDLNPSCYGE